VIDAVFFDGDQTLWDFQALMRRALAVTLARLRSHRPGPGTDGLSVEAMIADRQEVAGRLRGVETNLERIRQAAFAQTLARIGENEPGLADDLNAFYLAERFRGVDCYPDVAPALAKLGARYRLGLLSNGNGYPERAGLAGVFDAVVFSSDYGWEKPDPALYAVAAAQAGCAPGRLVMVGDSLVNDVVGAQRAGWRGIWLNREDAPLPDSVRPDATVTDLGQLADVLDRLDEPGTVSGGGS
jgi:putative hydrolase of the HAD superfamily